MVKKKTRIKQHYSGMAIASFILSILGAVWILFLLPPSPYDFLKIIFWYIDLILAIVFGFIGLNKIKKNRRLRGRRSALFGITLGLIVFGIITLGYLISLIG
jgi:uncharacterized BrkB/YihY/UPF0761 family membrane protein